MLCLNNGVPRRSQVGHHHGEFAHQILGLVGAGDAAENIAVAALAHVEREAQQLGRAVHGLAVHDQGNAQVNLGEVVDGDRGCQFFSTGCY